MDPVREAARAAVELARALELAGAALIAGVVLFVHRGSSTLPSSFPGYLQRVCGEMARRRVVEVRDGGGGGGRGRG